MLINDSKIIWYNKQWINSISSEFALILDHSLVYFHNFAFNTSHFEGDFIDVGEMTHVLYDLAAYI